MVSDRSRGAGRCERVSGRDARSTKRDDTYPLRGRLPNALRLLDAWMREKSTQSVSCATVLVGLVLGLAAFDSFAVRAAFLAVARSSPIDRRQAFQSSVSFAIDRARRPRRAVTRRRRLPKVALARVVPCPRIRAFVARRAYRCGGSCTIGCARCGW